MKIYDCKNYPIRVYGLPNLYTGGQYNKLDDFFVNKMPWLREKASRSTVGVFVFVQTRKLLH